MIRVGMTGTRKGMNQSQSRHFSRMLRLLNPGPGAPFHHGDCIGSDEQGFMMAKDNGYRTYSHPPIITVNQAWTKSDVILSPADYMVRNRDIVEAADRMLATPDTKQEKFQGSGTWSAIRYSIKCLKPICIIFPDGDVAFIGDWPERFK